ALELEEGEFDALETQLKRARHAEKFRNAQSGAQYALYRGNGAAVERIGEACSELRKLTELDPEIEPLIERLEEAEAIVSDVYYEIEAREDAAGFIDNLDNLESRHQQLRVAMRRFATDEEGLIERH